MSNAAALYSLSPIKLNTTVLAVANLNRSPDNDIRPQGHSGNLFPSIMTHPSALPRFQFRTPFLAAFNLIGFGVLKLTALEVYMAKFVDFARSSSAVHRKYSLASNALACAVITGVSVEKNGVAWANVEVFCLSADGLAHPLAEVDNASLPTLSGEPALHTLGPIKVNGTTLGGVASLSMDLGQNYTLEMSDGDRFARDIILLGGAPTISGMFDSPEVAESTLTQLGVAFSSNFVAFFRAFDATSGLIDTGGAGISLTMASGKVIPMPVNTEYGQIAKGGFTAYGLSSTATHPVAVNSSATVPQP